MSGVQAGCDRILQKPFVGTWHPESAGLILSGRLESRRTSSLPWVGNCLPPVFWAPHAPASPSSMRLHPGSPCEKGPGLQLCWVWFREPPGAGEGKRRHRSPGDARCVDRGVLGCSPGTHPVMAAGPASPQPPMLCCPVLFSSLRLLSCRMGRASGGNEMRRA